MRPAALVIVALTLCAAAPAEDLKESLWEAARLGDVKLVKEVLEKGADVNARTSYGATALWFAAYKGRVGVAKLLLEHKANPDLGDRVWGLSPLQMAVSFGHLELITPLLEAKARGADALLVTAAARGDPKLLEAILAKHKPAPEALSVALLFVSKKAKQAKEVQEVLDKAGARSLPRGTEDEQKAWKALAGMYESPGGAPLRVALQDGVLVVTGGLSGTWVLRPAGKDTFRAVAEDVSLNFEARDGKPVRVRVKTGKIETVFDRSAQLPAAGKPGPFNDVAVAVKTPRPWPAFRGAGASGVADGQHPPAVWDLKKSPAGTWKTAIPGLGHACPVVWGDRVFIATAVSSDSKSEFKHGLYGAMTAAKDRSKHVWKVYCLDRKTGKVLWERVAFEGVPKVKRHLKASHANATPATDGKRLVVSFASEGLYCYDLEGKQLWKRDLGVLDAGAFNDPEAQWEAGSSPTLWRDLVIVQCDRQKDSYLAAFKLADGNPAWRTPRDEPPSWGTPTVIEGKTRPELVANGTNAIRGYDPATGKELWQLKRNSQITVPTPILGDGLIFVTSGYRPIQPIYAIWPGATGDITLKDRQESSARVAWSKVRGGPYMPTPIYYQGHLYTCSNSGVVSCYEGRTGKQLYRQRLGGTNGYTASPVAADGRLYFTSEDGQVHVVAAGPAFKLLAVNELGDLCLATPAISGGMILFRTKGFVMGIGRPS
jgi:outer membrane protein assembly factor BamB